MLAGLLETGYNGSGGVGRADVDPFVLYLMAMSEMENARQAGMTAREFAMSKGVPSTLTDAEAAQIDAFEYNMRTGKLPPGSENLKSVEEPSPSQETIDKAWNDETDEASETGNPDKYEASWNDGEDANGDTEGAEDTGNVATGGKSTRFTYKHNPSDNPKVLADAVEDSNAIYGYKPNKEGSLKAYADDDWSNADYVEKARQKRIAYHQRNEVGTLKLISSMRAQNYSDEQIVKAIVEFRNRNRLSSYLDAKGNIVDQVGYVQALEHCKTYEQLRAEGKTNEDILKSATRGNPGMDASTGLYDDYYSQYTGGK